MANFLREIEDAVKAGALFFLGAVIGTVVSFALFKVIMFFLQL